MTAEPRAPEWVLPPVSRSPQPAARITGIELIAVALPLTEPFVISYGTFPAVESVLVRLETETGTTGWGEGTPDPHVTGETFGGVLAALRVMAPALLGRDPLDRSGALRALETRIGPGHAPTAKAALDIALHDLCGQLTGLPVWAMLGGRAREHLTISRVVSLKAPEAMAADAARYVESGFRTVKLKVGDYHDVGSDIRRVAAVREAIGEDVRIKIDVNQGWRTAGVAIQGARGIAPYQPDYLEQPVDWRDLEGLADVRRASGLPVMADEAIHDARDVLRAVQLRACDLINIKLMKSGGLLGALQLNAVAETAGYVCQVGTMVESSIASAAGLHLALALENVQTVEMGGPLMLAEDLGRLRDGYVRDQVHLPDGPGLGIVPDEEVIRRYAGERVWVRAT
jgi:L-alanine-DL-glutamate epimerase-like enolase superfamily enzyme